MTEQPSFWRRFFGRRGTSSLNQRQEKVLQYIVGRMKEGAPLQGVLQEEYVRRNTSRAELEQVIRSPELIGAAREQLGEAFRSDEFKL